VRSSANHAGKIDIAASGDGLVGAHLDVIARALKVAP
jgi:hypothetical protein